MFRPNQSRELLRFIAKSNEYAAIVFWLSIVYIGFATLNGGYWEDHSIAWAIACGSGFTMLISYFAKEADSLISLVFQSLIFPIGGFFVSIVYKLEGVSISMEHLSLHGAFFRILIGGMGDFEAVLF